MEPRRWSLIRWLTLGVLLATFWPPLSARTQHTSSAGLLPAWFATPVIEPDLQRALDVPGDAPLRVIAILRPVSAASVPETRAALVTHRQTALTQARAPLESLLAAGQASGDLLAARELWVIRGLALTARPDLIRELLASPAVLEVRLDHYQQYVTPQATAIFPAAEAPTWGLVDMRVPEVWTTLGISGAGTVIALLDTGVDWQHPALQTNYRGYQAVGPADHRASWYDATRESLYPYDDHGHGTHVAGTAVGREFIGVAPDARWIGVKVLNGDGAGYDSWIHAGFQWLLAPNGDPALAPDIVSASWGSDDGRRTNFIEDIAALHAAGILPVFAAGNAGSRAGSVGSPASNPGVFAVGAYDFKNYVAYFSSRGPSPWGEIKPYVVAPGVAILSAQPGGGYVTANGTSMATPHVAGVFALMHAANPDLELLQLTRILTQTAVTLTMPTPNNDSGWGRVDALAAVLAVMTPGFVNGEVRGAGGAALPQATLHARPHDAVYGLQAQTDAQGRYALVLPDNIYDITATAFGHFPQTRWGFEVEIAAQHTLDFQLLPRPTGTLQGRVTVTESQHAPLRPVTLTLLETPLATTTDAEGYYALTAPQGVYTLEARAQGYRVARAVVTITADATFSQPFALLPAPTLLLVDEGAWHYSSAVDYWRAALDALDYAYEVHPIQEHLLDAPLSTTLALYDIVMWSSPEASPGWQQSGPALQAYMQQGGRLWVSGQDVAYYDLGSNYPLAYLFNQMNVRYLADNTASRTLVGQGPFSGLTIDIVGGDGADNQRYPDAVTARDPNRGAQVWTYTSGEGGGVTAEVCTPHRALFFGFGYEAIAAANDRQEVLQRALTWLAQPLPETGLAFEAQPPPVRIGQPGEVITHTRRLYHTAYTGVTETLTLTLSTPHWPTRLISTTARLAPCEWLTITVVVTIPETAARHTRDDIVLYVASERGAIVTTTLQTKTPAPVLLVDDDRWYPMEGYYQQALTAGGVPFDIWDTEHHVGGSVTDKSPSVEILQRYPVVIWFTGYDWYAPLLPYEIERLQAYLEAGGRLLFVSQEFLYKHAPHPLAARLGVLRWSEGHPTLQVSGVADHPAGDFWPPVTLDYPYPNWADVIEPQPEAAPVLRGEQGQPVGIAAGPLAAGYGRTLFYAFELAALPADVHATVLQRGVGWLSPLGQSTWTLTPTTPLPGERVTAVLALHNDAASTVTASFSHTLPAALELATETLPEVIFYDAPQRTLAWTGDVSHTAPLTFSWAMTVTGAPGLDLTPTVTLALPTLELTFARASRVRVGGANLEYSRWITAPDVLRGGTPVTLGLEVRNTGHTAITGTVHFWLMAGWTDSAAYVSPEGWEMPAPYGPLAPGASEIVTVGLRARVWDIPLRVDAVISDGGTHHWELRHWIGIEPWNVYLPQVLREN